jgi:tetratricopeptide (TPR) repeat protein
MTARALLVAVAVVACGACRGLSLGWGDEPRPVPLPDLSRSDASVQAQVREQHAVVERHREDGASPEQLGASYGDLGMILQAAEYFEAAEPALLNARMLMPVDPRWAYFLGHLYRRTGDVPRAVESFEAARQLRPDDVPTLVWLARMHLDRGEAADAEPLLQKAQSLAPKSVAVVAALGQAALARGDASRAARLLEEALTIDPRALSLHAPLASAYRALGQADRADSHSRRWKEADVPLEDPLMADLGTTLRSAVSFETRGVRALDSGNWAAAQTAFREGLTLTRPETPIGRSLTHKLGLSLYLGGNLQEALNQFEQATRLAPPTGHDEPASRAHYSLGIIMASGGRSEQAIAHLSKAVDYDATSVPARLALGDALRRAQREDESLPQYQEAMRINPQAAEARLGYGLAQVRLRRWAESRQWLEESVRAQPDRPELSHALARVLATAPEPRVRDGNRAAAIVDELFKTSKRIEVGETMAMTLAELGDFDKAAAIQRGVLGAAQRAGLKDDVRRMEGNLRLYEQRRPCRMRRPDPPARTAGFAVLVSDDLVSDGVRPSTAGAVSVTAIGRSSTGLR